MDKRDQVLTRLSIIIFLLLACAITLFAFSREKHRQITSSPEAEQILVQFIQSNHLNIRPNTTEYRVFLRDFLLGEYPELSTGKDSATIVDYALNYLGIPPDQDRKEIKPAPITTEQLDKNRLSPEDRRKDNSDLKK